MNLKRIFFYDKIKWNTEEGTITLLHHGYPGNKNNLASGRKYCRRWGGY
jgi:hypothetical protein